MIAWEPYCASAGGQPCAIFSSKVCSAAQYAAPRRANHTEEQRLTNTAAGALNQTFNTDLFAGGLLLGQATVIATTRH